MSYVPITIMHELAHYVTALFLGGRPSGFSLWPKRENGTWRLGSVTARTTLLSAAPTALAPLAWLLAGNQLIMQRSALAGDSLFLVCALYLAAYMCVAASIPSWQDVKVALMNPLSILAWCAIAGAAGFVTG